MVNLLIFINKRFINILDEINKIFSPLEIFLKYSK